MITKTIAQRLIRIVLLGLLLVTTAWTSAHAGTVTYYYTDPQGTPLAEADAQGNITATFDYRPYGSQALGTPPKGPGYTGHVNDPDTGLVYMQARYYDPVVGRFLSADPVPPEAGNAFNLGRYSYANNNPLRFIDPDGKSVTCSENSCTIDSHSILEAVVDHATVGVIYLERLIANARTENQSQTQQ
jgi:RHS repeat-associated protein